MTSTGTVSSTAPDVTARRHRLGRVAATGILATLAAAAATSLAAALAQAVGVDLVVVDGEEAIPVSGFAVVTGFFSVVGVVFALGLQRWSVRPRELFVRIALTLTALSLVPPFLSDADAVATVVLLGLHLVAASIMIPSLARSMGSGSGGTRGQR